MRKHWLVPFLAALAVGCNSPATNSDSTSSSANTAVSSPVTPDQNSPAPDPNNNPSRIHQLKDLQKVTIKAPKGDLSLWVMDTESKTQEGMMFLTDKEVKDNEGMIFVFPQVQKAKDGKAFWMHNTILALDIDYISKEGKVINIGLGKPQNDDQVPPKGDYVYVIELKQGMSGKFGIEPGTKLEIPSNVVAKP